MAGNSPLCKRCKVLHFDDNFDPASGAHVGILETLERYTKFESKELFPEYSLKDAFPNLPRLAAEQCGMCALMRERFLAIEEEDKRHYSTLEILGVKLDFAHFPRRMKGLFVYFKLNDGDTREVIFSVQAEPAGLTRRPIAPSALSESGISRIKEMVESAIFRTDLDTEKFYLPTRLICVGDEQIGPRLVVSKTHPPFLMEHEEWNSHRYIALSYCWGSRTEAEQQLKTTRDSLRRHMQGIPIEALPQTLLDALLVCRALGVQYLWVDALCIIQGDKSDWERESANMGNGDSCQSGFLKRRPLSQVEISFHSSLDPSISATSAVAKRFSTNVSGKYLAGQWEEDLHYGLLWVNTDCDGENSDMKTTYTAPSWSLACQPCPKAKVLTTETSFTIDPYGQITDGFVSLSAKAYKISSTRHWGIHVNHEPLFRHGSNGDSISDVTLRLPLASGEGGYNAHVRFDRNYILEEHLISQMSIVLICSNGWDEMLGLVVLPSATRDEYTRAGLFMSEGFIFGGAKFWDNVETTTIKLV
ncbi:hypothetical protein BDV41DRAFT_567522 [Aspergillus transmontanensis]|uniref:Heterokaryon incompatibility domain-containing protein n=1 Tax=Aspergillus transmontanensis TaxID=1034304 RepID=A0A5N6VLN6_9EURO|nr:hypothetical protein BDV41DRAFT_567522 [Aspergillus transmontanensis]